MRQPLQFLFCSGIELSGWFTMCESLRLKMWSAVSVTLHALTWSMHSKMFNRKKITASCPKMNRPELSHFLVVVIRSILVST